MGAKNFLQIFFASFRSVPMNSVAPTGGNCSHKAGRVLNLHLHGFVGKIAETIEFPIKDWGFL